MTSHDVDIYIVEDSIETWSQALRLEIGLSDRSKKKYSKRLKQDLNWLRQHAPSSRILKQDFSDIRM